MVIAIIGINVACFFIEKRFLFDIKDFRFQIYDIEQRELNDRLELAAITGEILPDYIVTQVIEKPSDKVNLPWLYYTLVGIFEVYYYWVYVV